MLKTLQFARFLNRPFPFAIKGHLKFKISRFKCPSLPQSQLPSRQFTYSPSHNCARFPAKISWYNLCSSLKVYTAADSSACNYPPINIIKAPRNKMFYREKFHQQKSRRKIRGWAIQFLELCYLWLHIRPWCRYFSYMSAASAIAVLRGKTTSFSFDRKKQERLNLQSNLVGKLPIQQQIAKRGKNLGGANNFRTLVFTIMTIIGH